MHSTAPTQDDAIGNLPSFSMACRGVITNPFLTSALSLQWLLFVLSQKFFSL